MSGSDVESSFIEAATADTDGVCASQSPGSATNMTINGALSSGGSVTFDEPRNVTIASAADDSGITFTVTGTDETATAATEVITGADTATATGTSFFATITQIATSGASAGAVTVGSGTSVSAVMFRGRMRLRGLYVVNGASAKTINFRETNGTGTVRMKFASTAGVTTNSYPDVPDEGILFKGGGYVTFTQADITAMTVFYS
jgi:hypothetical protein